MGVSDVYKRWHGVNLGVYLLYSMRLRLLQGSVCEGVRLTYCIRGYIQKGIFHHVRGAAFRDGACE